MPLPRFLPPRSLCTVLLITWWFLGAECRGILAAEASSLPEGFTPQQAVSRMTVPEGFRVQLAAGEPAVHQPIAFTFDPAGRIWLAEAYTYPQRAPEGEGRDRIVILEDSNADGSFDTRKVFAEHLNLVSGMELGFGGVWVGAAPYLLFIPDRNGDDSPDGPPEIVLDGFGYEDTHETLNSFIWGPDGWLYGCHGVFTHSLVGPPGASQSQRVPLNAGIWRYHPLRKEFEVFAWGTSNPWGLDFDRHGQAFCTACVIPHLYHVIQGGRYQRQAGSHFQSWVFDDIKTIADHKHYAGDIREHAWWGHEPTLPPDTSQAGGGHAHCGAMIYLADNWPEQYRDQLLMHNIHGNRINHDSLVPAGSGYVGRHSPDFLLANDPWFRGIALKYGPNGAVYLIDWYDRNACHRTTPEIWDRTNGRIYRVSYGEVKTAAPHLESQSDRQLVELHGHRNEWYVRMARRLLQERATDRRIDPQAVAQLRRVVGEGPVEQRLRGLWTLHAIGETDETLLLSVLSPESPDYLQAWGVQLACESKTPTEKVLRRIGQLADETDSPIVRLYVASAMQRIAPPKRWSLARALISHREDTEDHNLPLMAWYAVAPLIDDHPRRLLEMVERSDYGRLYEFAVRAAAGSPSGREAILATLNFDDAQACQQALHQMRVVVQPLGAVDPPSLWPQIYQRLVTLDKNPAMADELELLALTFGDRRILPRLRQRVADRQQPTPARRRALEALVQMRDREAVTTLLPLLDDRQLQSDIVPALAVFDDPEIGSQLVQSYRQFPESLRPTVIQTLASRTAWAHDLLDATAKEMIPRRDIHAYHIRQMLGLDDSLLLSRIREVWGRVGDTPEEKQAAIRDWKRRLAEIDRPADPTHGRRLFDQHCAKCHRLFGEGSDVGPDLTGSNRTNLDYVLENAVAPSAVVGRDYQLTVVTTVDGRVVQGIVTSQTEATLTLQTLDQPVTLRRSEIEDQTTSALSMMPDGLLDQLSVQDVADLVSYLASPTQLPIKGSPPSTPGPEGVVWEAEALPGGDPSQGVTQTQVMSGFAADHWSGDRQLWWTGAQTGSELRLTFPVHQPGRYSLELVMTRAPDYGAVQLLLDDKLLGGGEVVDLYSPVVVTTGILRYDVGELQDGPHTLTCRLMGKNPQAAASFMVGIDVIRLIPEGS